MKSKRLTLFLTTTGVALVLRLLHLYFMSDNPLFHRPIMDAAMHDQWARGILNGTWPGPEPFFRAPFYTYFLSALYSIFAGARFPVQAVHALISALGSGLSALIACRLYGRRAGYLAGMLMATLWTSIYFSAELLLVTLAVSLNLLVLWILLDRDVQPPSRQRIMLAGLVFGLSAITRPNILVTAPALIWYLYRSLPSGKRLYALVLFLICIVVPILPVTISNLVRGGDIVLISSQGGVNFYIGNNEQSDGRTAIVPNTRPTWQGGYEDAIALAEEEAGRSLKPSEVDRHYLRKGIAFLFDSPGAALKLYATKLRMLLGAAERSNNKFIYAWRDWSALLKLPIWPGWALVLGLSVLGFTRRDWDPAARGLLLWFSVLYALSILFFFVNARFRLPVAAVLTIPAGIGLDAAWSALRSDRRAEIWAIGYLTPVAALLVMGFSCLDFLGFKETRTDANPFHEFTLANAYADIGDPEAAIDHYRSSLEIAERYRHGNFHLIRSNLYRSYLQLLSGQGRMDEAVSVARQWVRMVPQEIEGRVWLGNLLLESGRIDEAAAHFDIAKRSNPEDPSVLSGEAWILYHQGQYGVSLRRFNQLYRLQPDARSMFGSGLCLIALDRMAEAEVAFLETLELEPGYWQALGNLAGIYERTGRLDQARTTYQELLQLRPGDERARQWLREHI